MPPVLNTPRIHQLDGLRALAIVSVFLNHATKARLLWMGVDLFFILSGFLITGVLLNAKRYSLRAYFAKFYARRARRILPPYLVILLVVSCISGFAWIRYWYFYILLTNLLGVLQIPHPVAFGPLWSLAVEEQFYLVWPFAVYFLSERRLAQVAASFVCICPILRFASHFHDYTGVYNLTPFRMDLLSVGALLCLAYRRRRQCIEQQGWKVSILSTSLGLGGLTMIVHYRITTSGNTHIDNALIYECSLLVCSGVMLWAVSGRYVRLLQWGPLVYIGKISYTMYLVHVGVIELFSRWCSGITGVVAEFAITVAYASVSWYLIEKRLLGGDRRNVSAVGVRSV
jgi:peptidoglycan/LPS O-acetylase OafA/YrhL